MNNQSIEQEIQSKGLTAPRVTLDELKSNIAHTEIVKHVSSSGQVLRWAVLTAKNGFAVTGRPSASASSENDNAEIGEKIAIENATQELWPLMGYALKQRLYEASPHPSNSQQSSDECCIPCLTGNGMCVAKKAEFEAKARGLIDWLCENGHPHMTIVITPTSAELLEGTFGIQTTEYLRD